MLTRWSSRPSGRFWPAAADSRSGKRTFPRTTAMQNADWRLSTQATANLLKSGSSIDRRSAASGLGRLSNYVDREQPPVR